jgi:Protein of unknown function (DUF3828)
MRFRLTIALLTCFLLGPSVRSQDVESAKAFVQQVYGDYANPDSQHQERRQAKFYTPELYRLIVADRKGHPGDVGKLDGDPICDCQDPGNPGELRVQSVKISVIDPARVKASVGFVIAKEPREAVLSLRFTASGWKIDDIETKDMSSLRGMLRGK